MSMPKLSVKIAFALSRVLLAIMFAESALSHIIHYHHVLTEAEAMGLPLAFILFPISIGFELFGIAALLLNRGLKLALAILLVFTLSSTMVFFPFWAMESSDAALALQNFVKNFALVGFILLLYAESDSKSRTFN